MRVAYNSKLLVAFYSSSHRSIYCRSQGLFANMCSLFSAGSGHYLARYVLSAVCDSRMWCPHNIGRDSWVWEEQLNLEIMISPTKGGMRRSSREGPCQKETGWPVDVSDCCCCCCCCCCWTGMHLPTTALAIFFDGFPSLFL